MPIIPPSLPWVRAAVDAVTATADRALDVGLDLAMTAYVPPRPMPEPLNYVGIIYSTSEGIIEQITDAATLTTLAELRNKITSSSDGDKGMKIVEVAIGKRLAPGQPTSRILDVIEATQRAGYEPLGIDFRL
jgi:hypothetical protein